MFGIEVRDSKRPKIENHPQQPSAAAAEEDSQLTTDPHLGDSLSHASDPEQVLYEDKRFFNTVTCDCYKRFITEACQDELDGIDSARMEERYKVKRRNATSLQCSVRDTSNICLNVLADDSLSCYNCKLHSVCLECWTKCRRCNSCYIATNRTSAMSALSAANGNNDPITDDVFLLRSEHRLLSVEENLFCAQKLRSHTVFARYSIYTMVGESSRLTTSAVDRGYFFIDFQDCVARHPDTRVVRLIPLYIQEQLVIGLFRNRELLIPYETNLRASGRTVATIKLPDFMSDVFENFKQLLLTTGVIPSTAAMVALNGLTNHVDLMCAPPGATCEENHEDFPALCKCCQVYEPDDEFKGCTMLANCSDKLISFGVGQPANSHESNYGIEIEPSSCLFLMAPFQYFGYANADSEAQYIYRTFFEKKLGMRQKIGEKVLFVPSDEFDEEDD